MSEAPPYGPKDERRRAKKRRQPFRAGGAPSSELGALAGVSIRVFYLGNYSRSAEELRGDCRPATESRNRVQRGRIVEVRLAQRFQRWKRWPEVLLEPDVLAGRGEEEVVESDGRGVLRA